MWAPDERCPHDITRPEIEALQCSRSSVLVASSTKYTPCAASNTRPKSAPAPGGEPDESINFFATCWPPGLISVMKPSPPFTLRRWPPSAMAMSPSGAFKLPPDDTVVPVPPEVLRVSGCANARDPVIQGIRHVELQRERSCSHRSRRSVQRPSGPMTSAAGSVRSAKPEPTTVKACSCGIAFAARLQIDAHDRAAVNHLAVSGNRAIQHVGDKELRHRRDFRVRSCPRGR